MNQKRNHLVYRLTKMNGPKMAYRGKRFPTTFTIPTKCVVYDEETGRPTTIRYVVGEPELILSKQQKNAIQAPAIQFNEGFLIINKNEITLAEYLSLVGWNEAVEKKQPKQSTLFKLVDEVTDNQTQFEKREMIGKAEALFWALFEEDKDKVRATALHFGIDITKPSWRNRITDYIKKEPIKFRNFVENVDKMENAMRVLVIFDARMKGILTFANSKWSWTNGSAIVAVPRGTDAHEFLSAFTFAGVEGATVWNHLVKIMNPEAAVETVNKEEVQDDFDLLLFDELLAAAKEAKVIYFKGAKFNFEYDNGDVITVAKSAKGVLERMSEDAGFLEAVKNALRAKS